LVSDTQITAVTPASASAGAVDVTVTAGGVSSATSPPDLFTYTAPAPTVTLSPIRRLTQTTVTLNGSVSPGGQAITNCRFQYGTGNQFGSSVACQYTSAGTSDGVSVSVTGLAAGTTYQYRLTLTTAGGTATSQTATFKTPAPPVPPILAAPRVGLLLVRVTHSRYIAELLGVQGISGAAVGESLVLWCVSGCQHPFRTTIPLRTAKDMTRRIGFPRSLPLLTTTRINIDVSANGKISRYASYAFYISRGALAIKITKAGCIKQTKIQRCPGT
jgi:hypothetical protein